MQQEVISENIVESKRSFWSKIRINIFAGNSLLLTLGGVYLLIAFGDAIMSYVVPDYMQTRLGNSATEMGLVLATSSIVGLISDFLFGEWFRYKKFGFFLKWAFIFAVTFPLSFILLPGNPAVFVFAMAVWGIYYEFMGFSNSAFISSSTPKEQHAFAWGLISMFKAVSYTFGPVVAEWLLDKGDNAPFYGTLLFLGLGFIGFAFLQKFFRPKHAHKPVITPLNVKMHSVVQELKVWRTLIGRLWYLLVFSFILSLIDATFWSTGTVLSQQIHTEGTPGGVLLLLYGIPSLFMGVFVGKIAKPYGKKKAAFYTAILSTVFLILAGFTENISLLLVFVFISSVFSSISFPEIRGVFADYDQRLHESRNTLIGIESSSLNLAYIIGPIIAGVLSDAVGPQKTFAIIGIFALIVIILVTIKVPRKVRLPTSDVEYIDPH